MVYKTIKKLPLESLVKQIPMIIKTKILHFLRMKMLIKH